MKKLLVSTLLAGCICLSLAGCTEPSGGGTGINENTDPITLQGERVDQSAWNSAFNAADNYSIKQRVNAPSTAKDGTMFESKVIMYQIDGEKMHMELVAGEREAEAYLKLCDGDICLWQRTREGGEWSEWSGAKYSAEDFGEAAMGNTAFLKDYFAHFNYSENEKGYEATTMSEKIHEYVGNLVNQSQTEVQDFSLEKFVLKINGGRPSACIFDLSFVDNTNPDTQEPEVEQEPEGEADGEQKPSPDPESQIPQPETGNPQEPDPSLETARLQKPPQTRDEAQEGGKIDLQISQLYFNYGTTKVTLPNDLPDLSGAPRQYVPQPYTR